jgi:ribose 5-phosphate isomerase B
MKIALTTDHTGLAYDGDVPAQLQQFLEGLGHECVNFGPTEFNPDDDYPDFMFPAARAVAGGDCDVAVILGGSGQGEAMAANRVKGVRCTVFYGPAVAVAAVDAEGKTSDDPYEILRLSRRHNHANVLSLATRFLTTDDMKQAIRIWLETPYDDAPRHARRVAKLDQPDG